MIKITVKEYQEIRDRYLLVKDQLGDVKASESFGVGFVQALNWLWKNHQIETQIILEEES